MRTKHVVDAHALIWYLEDNPKPGLLAKEVLADPASDLILPAIALAEACWAIETRRTAVSSQADLLAALDADPRINIEPLDRDLVERSSALTAVSEMHDRQIVASALRLADTGYNVDLLTRDQNIRDSGLVRVVW